MAVRNRPLSGSVERIRKAYPDKQIYAAATWQLGRNSRSHTEQLKAVDRYVDVLMLEVYLRESRQLMDNRKLGRSDPGDFSRPAFQDGLRPGYRHAATCLTIPHL
ncbi:MAG: hypothetical protein CM1200mP2_44840 [Planctomycetaceae bacterium]|nr:MAG: hypothetical protein CM1200mP2_44840 [Planctomycetaceae bacterium]